MIREQYDAWGDGIRKPRHSRPLRLTSSDVVVKTVDDEMVWHAIWVLSTHV